MHKTFIPYILSFYIEFNTLEVVIGIKPAPGDHKSNFKKVGSIPCGFNSNGTDKLCTIWYIQISFQEIIIWNFKSFLIQNFFLIWIAFINKLFKNNIFQTKNWKIINKQLNSHTFEVLYIIILKYHRSNFQDYIKIFPKSFFLNSQST